MWGHILLIRFFWPLWPSIHKEPVLSVWTDDTGPTVYGGWEMPGNSPDISIIYDARQKYLSLQIKGRECSLKIDMKNDLW